MIFSVYGVCFSDYNHEKCITLIHPLLDTHHFDTPISTLKGIMNTQLMVDNSDPPKLQNRF